MENEFSVFINERVLKLSIGWIESKIRGAVKDFCKKNDIIFNEKDFRIRSAYYTPSKYYGESFWIRPVNQETYISATSDIKVSYDGEDLWNSKEVFMIGGDVIANSANRSGAIPQIKGVGVAENIFKNPSSANHFLVSPTSNAVHKLYMDQKNYVPEAASSSMTYYDTATLTDKARKKLNTLKKTVNTEEMILDAIEVISSKISEKQKNKTPEAPKKEPEVKKLKIGDGVDSKNGMEFVATVIDIKGSKVTLTYDIEGYGDETTGTTKLSNIKWDGYGWSMPSWSI